MDYKKLFDKTFILKTRKVGPHTIDIVIGIKGKEISIFDFNFDKILPNVGTYLFDTTLKAEVAFVKAIGMKDGYIDDIERFLEKESGINC